MMNWRTALADAWTGLSRNKSMAFSVILVTMVSMFLLGCGLLAQRQVSAMKGYWYDRVQVTVYLCTGDSQVESCASGAATAAQKQTIKEQLTDMTPLVKQVYFESAQQAYTHFLAQFKESPMASDIRVGDIPESFRVQLSDPSKFQTLTDAIRGAPGVARVEDQRQVLEKIFRWINVITVASLSLAALMLVAAVLMMATTIRQAAHSRRREISIMRLVGASNATIRVPFIIEVVLAGLVGTAAAIVLLSIAIRSMLSNYVGNTVSTAVIGQADLLIVGPVLVLLVVGMAVLTSVLTLSRALRV